MSVRLHLNESPFPPSPYVGEYLARYATILNRYESKELETELLRELASYVGLEREYISIYPSSSAALITILKYTKRKGFRFLMTFPGFHAIKEFAELEDISVEYHRLTPRTFKLNEDALLRELDKRTVLYISNPNNPTSNILITDEKTIVELCERSALLVLDEAYYEFSGITFTKLLRDGTCENLVIIRTFSKAFALAGARIGYLLGNPKTLSELNSYRPLFDVPIPSMAAALAALRDKNYVMKLVASIKYLRDKLRSEVESLGLYILPSATNFLFIELPTKSIIIAEKLKKQGILVKPYSDPGIENYIRVSVGSEEENRKFIEALKNVLKEKTT